MAYSIYFCWSNLYALILKHERNITNICTLIFSLYSLYHIGWKYSSFPLFSQHSFWIRGPIKKKYESTLPTHFGYFLLLHKRHNYNINRPMIHVTNLQYLFIYLKLEEFSSFIKWYQLCFYLFQLLLIRIKNVFFT